MLEEYWVLQDEKTGLYLVQFAEGRVISSFLHHRWKEAKRFTDLNSAQRFRADKAKAGKEVIWKGLKPRKISVRID